ncbi:MAG: signal recognition particle protein [Thermoprotei archaeon]|nr:MAG: signal recognition particle protein [Thermoprotei archaeon]
MSNLKSLSKSLIRAIDILRRATFVDRRIVKETIREIQRALLMADVDVRLVLELSRKIEKRVFEEDPPPGFTRRDIALKAVYEELLELLGGSKVTVTPTPSKFPYTIMLVGIQGSGKTTTAAKLAYFYKKKGFSVGLICADNYRPAALVQLKQLGDKVGVEVYGNPRLNPVEIAKRGIEYFKKKGKQIIIIDTAGRHKEERGLIEEMRKLAETIRPSEVMMVIDSTIGRQAGPQAAVFSKATPIGSIFLAKLDGSAKGGGAIAAIVATNAKIKFIGTGEDVSEIEVFNPQSFINRLLGLGDLQYLVKRLEEAKLSERIKLERIVSGKITLLDFREMLESMQSFGPLSKFLESIPGLKRIDEKVVSIGEEKIKRWRAILNSMTKEELLNPSIIDRSRSRRIAKGAGVTLKDVKDLLKSYSQMKKMQRALSKRDLRRILRQGRFDLQL